jgi:LPXTG-motif cell wall-anchored protein
MSRLLTRVVFGVAVLVGLAPSASAQTTTTTKETKKFEVIAVEGNHLVVRLPEGTREFTVPPDFKFNVDGKDMAVSDLKPGMKGTATVTASTTVTPVSVTEVRNGTVLRNAGTAIIVRTQDGTVRMFSQGDVDKRNVQIYRNGQPAQITDFRANDRLTATIVTEKPPKVVTEREVKAMLAQNNPPADAAAPAPASPAPSTAKPAPAATAGTAPAPKKLPKTASPLPAVGLTGLALLASAAALTVRRRRLTH